MADIFYPYSRQEAKREGELGQWKKSHQTNVRCARDIENLIDFNHRGGRLGMFGTEHCAAGDLDYTGKVLTLRPDRLKDECWSAQNQVWYGECGFGCSPTASGQAVFATCLGDGEKARWNRADFVGVLDEQYLPDWAQERLTELRGSDQEQTDGPAQSGMEMG